jgi:hypothetical protein
VFDNVVENPAECIYTIHSTIIGGAGNILRASLDADTEKIERAVGAEGVEADSPGPSTAKPSDA